MARHLKTGTSETEKAEENAKVRAIVESTLAGIEARGDAAVAEMSKKFDGWE
ncbi:MAG: histidinol dehydrogenase, partial [Alphaproteobacteria bacterium]|nr:histidinol dehydrogenase [Alphaproteobacteria bacterium]